MIRLSRSLLVASILAACAFAPACSSEEPDQGKDLAARLEADTGVRWGVVKDARDGEVRFLAPDRPVKVGDGSTEKVARDFFARYNDALHGTGDASELRVRETYEDKQGTEHVVFDHFLPGTEVRVFDAVSAARFRDGMLALAEPAFRADLASVAKQPSVSKDDATRAAMGFARTTCSADADPTADGAELGVSAEPGSPARLVWRVAFGAVGSCGAPQVDVDALDGKPIGLLERAHSAFDMGSGFRKQLFNELSNEQLLDVVSTPRPGELTALNRLETEFSSTKFTTAEFRPNGKSVLVTSTTPGVWDTQGNGAGSAVDAHAYMAKALEYFEQVHGRIGYDGKGTAFKVFVHDNSKTNSFGANAFFWTPDNPAQTAEAHFGDGDFWQPNPGNFLPLSCGFDVVVHELTHGVTGTTSKLVYAGESGALNESFSDVMGAAAEQWSELFPDEANLFRVGEKATSNGLGLRDMQNPKSHNDPDHYTNRNKCSGAPTVANDLCFVHSNSAIPNKAFALMTAGGDHFGLRITGLGWETTRDLWFRSMTNLRKPRASFVDAALEQVMTTVWTRPDNLATVACAWSAVGVLKLDELPFLQTVTCTATPGPVVDLDNGKAPPPPPPAAKTGPCGGHASGYVCDPKQAFTAFECKDGHIQSGISCASMTQKCHPASPTDPTATVTDGKLLCD